MAPVVIPSIAPERVTPSFLSTFRDQTNNPEWASWERGISFTSGCHQVVSWPGCTDPDDEAQKDEPAERGVVTFEAITQYTPIGCEWVLDTTGVDNEAKLFLNAGPSPTLALAVLAGFTPHGVIDNPSLVSSAAFCGEDTEFATGLSPGQGLALLLSCHGLCTMGTRKPYIHIPLRLLPFMISKGLVWPEGDFYRGPGGAIVSSDPGYLTGDVAPSAYDGAGSDDEAWMYISGPIEYALGEINVYSDTDVRRQNRYDAQAERQVIYRFDPCCIGAVRVVVPDECCSVTDLS